MTTTAPDINTPQGQQAIGKSIAHIVVHEMQSSGSSNPLLALLMAVCDLMNIGNDLVLMDNDMAQGANTLYSNVSADSKALGQYWANIMAQDASSDDTKDQVPVDQQNANIASQNFQNIQTSLQNIATGHTTNAQNMSTVSTQLMQLVTNVLSVLENALSCILNMR